VPDTRRAEPQRAGGGEVTVKAWALETVPAGVVTRMVPVVAPTGTVVLMTLDLSLITEVGVPLKLTVAPNRRVGEA
jgi:hypothetical protein